MMLDKYPTMNKTTPVTAQQQEQRVTDPLPDESASFSVEGHIKIFDFESKEVFVEKRA